MKPIAHGRVAQPKGMNKLEAAWSLELRVRAQQGKIAWWRYESITLKLGHDCRYCCDFAVLLDTGEMVFYECKGFMRDDALVKLKVAARDFPFSLILVTRDKGGWKEEEVQA